MIQHLTTLQHKFISTWPLVCIYSLHLPEWQGHSFRVAEKTCSSNQIFPDIVKNVSSTALLAVSCKCPYSQKISKHHIYLMTWNMCMVDVIRCIPPIRHLVKHCTFAHYTNNIILQGIATSCQVHISSITQVGTFYMDHSYILSLVSHLRLKNQKKTKVREWGHVPCTTVWRSKHGSCSMVVHQHLLSKRDGSLSCQIAHWNNKLCQDFNIHVGSQKLHQQNSCNGIVRAFNLTNNSLPTMSLIFLRNTGYNRVHIAFLWCYSQKNLQVSYKFLTPRRFDVFLQNWVQLCRQRLIPEYFFPTYQKSWSEKFDYLDIFHITYQQLRYYFPC